MSKSEDFQRQGFFINPESVVPKGTLDDARAAVADVAAGRYATGVAPLNAQGLDDPNQLAKIDDAHWSDERIHRVVTSPGVGQLAAEVVGADWVQLWASQLLIKPPSKGSPGAVGWHQDQNYWTSLWEGEVFTLWLALDSVDFDMGPLRFVKGSHAWGYREGGNFWSQDLEAVKADMVPDGAVWDEAISLLEAGGASVHNKLTVHGSTENTSQRTRLGMALHLRTDRSKPVDGCDSVLVRDIGDEHLCPVLYRA